MRVEFEGRPKAMSGDFVARVDSDRVAGGDSPIVAVGRRHLHKANAIKEVIGGEPSVQYRSVIIFFMDERKKAVRSET